MAARVDEVEANVLRVFLRDDRCEDPQPWGIDAGVDVDRLEENVARELVE